MMIDFRFLYENMSIGVVIHDASGVITDANDRATQILGLSLEQLSGRDSLDPRWKSIKPDGSDFPGDEHPAMITLKTGKSVKNCIMGVFNPRVEELVWLEVNSFPEFDDQTNKIVRVYALFSDVTSRVQAENALEIKTIELTDKQQFLDSLLQSQTSYLLRTDLSGSYVYANDQYFKDYGWIYQSEQLTGQSIINSVMDYHHKLVQDIVNDCLNNPGRIFPIEIDKPDSKGGVKSTAWEFVTYNDKGGEIAGIQCVGLDLTALKENEKQRKAAEEKYRSIVENAHILTVIINKKGRITFANQKVLNLLNINEAYLNENEVLLESFYDLGFQKEEMYKDLKRIFRTGEPYSKIINLNIHGEKIWVKGTATPIYNDFHEVEAIHVGAIDITEIRDKEEQLKKSEARYRELIETSESLITVVDAKGNYIHLNKKAIEYSGKSDDFYIGRSIWNDFEKERAEELLVMIQEVMDTNEVITIESCTYFNNTESCYQSTFKRLDNFLDNENCVMIVSTDVTQRVAAERRLHESEVLYRTVVETSDSIIATFDPKGKCTFANSYAANTIGKSLDEILESDMRLQDLFPTERSKIVENDFVQIIKEKKGFDEEVAIEINGDHHFYKSSLRPITDNNGNVISILLNAAEITDLKKSEQDLRESLEEANKLRQIIDQSPVSIIKTDLDGNITYVNPAVEHNIGYSVKELIGQNPKIWKSENTVLEHFVDFWETLLRGDTWRGEFENIRKDGTQITESSTAFPIFNNSGEIINLVVIQEDVTEIKANERALKLFNYVFENSVSGQIIMNQTEQIVHCNKTFLQLTGKSSDEIKSSSLIDYVDNDSKPIYKMLLKRMNNSDYAQGEILLASKNGESTPVLISFNLIDVESDFLAVSFIDISARKAIEDELIALNLTLEANVRTRTEQLEHANEQLNTFFDSSVDLLCIASQDGRFIKVSKSFTTILGYEKEELEGIRFFDLIHPDDIENTTEKLERLNSQETVLGFINRYRTKKGEYRSIEWYASPVDEYIYAVARDVTESIEQQNRLIEAREQAEYANAQKSKFLSRMSHELRTPLNSILGFAQILEMNEMNAMQEAAVAHILKSGKNLLQLINEVLEISRIESGSISLSIEPVNLTLLLNEVCDSLSPMSENAAVSIIRDETVIPNIYVKADQQRTKQILTNLINNAIKYNKPQGSVILSIEQFKNEERVEFIRLLIKDTGVGIDKADLKKLFEPFQRIHAENSEIEGTGLGLAVVKELIEALGGNVGVSSKKDEGSIFWIDLPKCTTTMSIIENEMKIQPENELKSRNTVKRILYIEDNPSNIDLMRSVFNTRHETYELRIEINGKDGLSSIRQNLPDLLLLDLDLPDMHGSEILKIIRSDEKLKELPVIIVSADATNERIGILLDLGANHYITKPIDINDLMKSIEKVFVTQ